MFSSFISGRGTWSTTAQTKLHCRPPEMLAYIEKLQQRKNWFQRKLWETLLISRWLNVQIYTKTNLTKSCFSGDKNSALLRGYREDIYREQASMFAFYRIFIFIWYMQPIHLNSTNHTPLFIAAHELQCFNQVPCDRSAFCKLGSRHH